MMTVVMMAVSTVALNALRNMFPRRGKMPLRQRRANMNAPSLSESKWMRGRVSRRSALQIDNGSFGGRSNVRGSVPDRERGGTATIGALRSLRLTLLIIETSTPAKW
jgi:hypothetical protein